MQNDPRAGFWRLADPKISLASFAGMVMAGFFAAADGALAWGWFALTFAGIFCIEVAKNASGEVVDFDSGTDQAVAEGDRSPFSGGKRVLVDGLLTRRQCWAIAAVFFGLGIAAGLVIVALREPRILYLGVLGVALAWFYHGGPLRLSYRGLGELAVALAYGPLVVCGTYLVQTGEVTAPVAHASGVLGLLVAAFLWINQFPDYRADRSAGKRNLVVRLGIGASAGVFLVIVVAAYLWLGIAALSLPGGEGMLWGLLGALPAGIAAVKLLAAKGETRLIVPAQAATLASFIVMALGCGAGYLLVG
jgi:1,4-dihydroxy-2-naphthoate octaprenyltransferase